MDTVLQVITMLENIQITKEQLETTRLGKYINLLRRKTANESLARRAKNLLKKWREMVLPSVGAGHQQQQQPQHQQQHEQQSNLTPKGNEIGARSIYSSVAIMVNVCQIESNRI